MLGWVACGCVNNPTTFKADFDGHGTEKSGAAGDADGGGHFFFLLVMVGVYLTGRVLPNFCCLEPNEKIWISDFHFLSKIYFLDDFITKNPHTENTIN